MILTEEMIEAAAKAFFDADPRSHNLHSWPLQNDTSRDVYRDMARAALTAVLPMLDGWQPIETAPKDGTEVLACRMYDGKCITMGIASWGDCRSRPNGYVASGDKPTWRAYDPSYLFPTPTHWRPLPPPPKGEGT